MKPDIKDKPREFGVGAHTIRDFGRVHFQDGEMITLVSPSGRECDVTAMEWGFYLAPSLNSRLRAQGFKVALVCNSQGKLFLNAVEVDKENLFDCYLLEQQSRLICWLDEELCQKVLRRENG
jgi:hypothetical protein